MTLDIKNEPGFWGRINAVAELQDVCVLQRCLLYVLLHHSGVKDACYPSIDRLVMATGASRRAVVKHLKLLAARGLVAITRTSGHRSTYRIAFDPCTTCTGQLVHDVHPRESDASTQPVHDVHQTNARPAPEPVHVVHMTGAPRAPKHTLTSRLIENKQHVIQNNNSKIAGPWKLLTDYEVRRIVKELDRETFLEMDAEGIAAFGWPASEVSQRERAGLWSAAVRKSKTSGSAAALLKAALRNNDESKYLTATDERFAQRLLVERMPPAISSSPFKSPTHIVPDEAAD